MGRVYNWDGKRLSSQVLAVVRDRYWGLPWYWPKVVILDGSYPCDIAMEEGQDYLVSGRRERYGVLGVAVCSRTQLLICGHSMARTAPGQVGRLSVIYTREETTDCTSLFSCRTFH
jgi:hypothetical protein